MYNGDENQSIFSQLSQFLVLGNETAGTFILTAEYYKYLLILFYFEDSLNGQGESCTNSGAFQIDNQLGTKICNALENIGKIAMENSKKLGIL